MAQVQDINTLAAQVQGFQFYVDLFDIILLDKSLFFIPVTIDILLTFHRYLLGEDMTKNLVKG